MGFYFPNMDKPECCAECPCIDEGNTGLEPYCPILKTIIYDVNAIHKDCIMVETKSPHGRLIDADKLEKVIEKLQDKCEFDVAVTLNWVITKIRKAPTIIKAEGE